MDIRLYFCHRGLENMTVMTKKIQGQGISRKPKMNILKTDDLMKKKIWGCMIENLVIAIMSSFILHKIPRLNTCGKSPTLAATTGRVSQRRPNVVHETTPGKRLHWFLFIQTKQKMRTFQNKHESFLRVTGTCILFKNNFADSEIVSITGHNQ